MSIYDYREARRIGAEGYSFYGLLMAVMLQSDTKNSAKLREAFPDVRQELQDRYDAPGGLLEGER